MSSENSYQPPLVDSTPSTDAEDATLHRRPTWRLWILALIGLPMLIGALGQMAIATWASESFVLRLLLIPVELLILLVYCGAIFVIARNGGRSPQPASMDSNLYGFKIAAIVILALIAVPSAFFNTCTPIGFGGGSISYAYGENNEQMAAIGIYASIAIGVIVGITCAILTIRLAYNLWHDACGGLQQSAEQEKIARPIPRLKAKKPNADNI